MSNPYAAYRQTQARTAGRGDLVVMLYEGAIRFATTGAAALQQHDWEAAHQDLIRAQAIIAELLGSLNPDAGDLAANLASIYEYLHRRLVDANVQKDPAPAEEVAEHLKQMLPAWQQVARTSATAQVAGAVRGPARLPAGAVA